MKYLCFDVGGTNIKYALMDETALILEKGRFPSVTDSLEGFCEGIYRIYEKYEDQIEGVSFSMPGVIEPLTGYFYSGGAFQKIIHDINLKEVLSEKIRKPMSFANDAKCAAMGELGYGCLKEIDDAIVIVLGTAVGGCVIKDHRIVYGKHLCAGEFSYVSFDGEPGFSHMVGVRCGNGVLLERVQKELGTDEVLSGEEIFDRAEAGDEKVCRGLHAYCRDVALLIYNLQAIYDPEVFAIGGGISARSLLMEELNSCFEEFKTEMSPFYLGTPKLVTCQHRNDANLIGALHTYLVENTKE